MLGSGVRAANPRDRIADGLFSPVALEIDRSNPDGLLLRSRSALAPELPLLPDRLCHWASLRPNETFVAAKNASREWDRVTYRDARELATRIGRRLLGLGLSAERPLLILSPASIKHALLKLAAMQVGVPYVPLSPSLSISPGRRDRLRLMADLITPGLIYAEDGVTYGPALTSLAGKGRRLTAGNNPGSMPEMLEFEKLVAPESALDTVDSLQPPTLDTTAAIFFTSGSTGDAKGVINTHRMFSANQQAIAALWPFLGTRRPVLLDWLPWHHTFGGNDNFNKILWNGGTLYIDHGRPEPTAIQETIANLRQITPSLHINVPRGLELLIPLLESDATFRDRFFCKLDLIFFAGAALPLPLCERLRRLVFDAEATHGRAIGMVSGWGATEAGSTICLGFFESDRPDNLGLPLPGFTLKLAPVENRFEARVRGPNVTPGYWRRADLTAAAFDEEGYYCTGDAVRFAEASHPEAGLLFDGRLAEDFKLTNGSWVQVSKLRTDLLAVCAPLLRDIAIAGIGRDEIGILAFLNPESCRQLGIDPQSDSATAATSSHVHVAVKRAVETHNRDNPNATRRIGRMILTDDVPSPERGEINDKAYLNQLMTLANRSAAIEMLFNGDPAPTKLIFPK